MLRLLGRRDRAFDLLAAAECEDRAISGYGSNVEYRVTDDFFAFAFSFSSASSFFDFFGGVMVMSAPFFRLNSEIGFSVSLIGLWEMEHLIDEILLLSAPLLSSAANAERTEDRVVDS